MGQKPEDGGGGFEQVRGAETTTIVLEELPAAREEERSLLSVLRAFSCGEGEDVAIELLGASWCRLSVVEGCFTRYEVFGRRAEALLGGKLGLYATDGREAESGGEEAKS